MPRRGIARKAQGFKAQDTVTALDALRDPVDRSSPEAALETLTLARRGEAG